ncbi:MAG: SAM hydrolase/SAM-dependent halogenase family protein [Planctomycetota bacterium]
MIVLLTDFGQSEYVGIMKGVIYKIAPDAKIVDLCHDISPQNIIEASWILKNNYMYFPEGAVFCCVVDPGVGTQRKALAVRTEDYYFVAPDNGILWETLKHQRIIEIRQIPVPPDASRTFHGRDVFAKAAVNIDLGNFNEVGEKIKEIEKLELYQNQRQGIVVRIDRFGNIVTNLTKQDKDEYSLQIADRKYVMNFYPDYDSANEGDLFLIEGSCNTLEISLKNGNAVDKLNVKVGEKITIS